MAEAPSPLSPDHDTPSNIKSWLDGIMGDESGCWGERFGDAFEEVGLEDTADFEHLQVGRCLTHSDTW